MILPLVMFLALAQHPCSGGSQPKNDPDCIPAEMWIQMQPHQDGAEIPGFHKNGALPASSPSPEEIFLMDHKPAYCAMMEWAGKPPAILEGRTGFELQLTMVPAPPPQRHEDGAWITPPKVTIVGVGQDEMQKDFLICDAILGKFQNCVLAGVATLDDLAFWQGYSAHIVGDVLKKLQKENDELREDNRKLRLALKAIQAMAADKAGKK